MKWLYSLGVASYSFAVRIASVWNPKAKKWLRGRKEVWQKLAAFQAGENVYWFHCASLGEFEQGRPIIERLKEEENCQIVLTFFSPSGYDVRKNYEGADLITYLPVDTQKNAQRFINSISPKKVFFIKYEFWAHYILTCAKNKIPIYSVAALFRENQVFFKLHGGFMRTVLQSFNKIFVQNEESQQLLNKIGIDAIICGDTRFDRVMANAENVKSYIEIEEFVSNKKVLICGSIWQDDLNVIHQKISELKDWKVIIAPHEISPNFIAQIERKISLSSIRYSNIGNLKEEQLLIIDNIGMLMNLYQYGDLAYIGGAFKTGLHNILEPAAFGLPVIFGNRIEKFPEASLFIENGIGFKVNNQTEFSAVLNELKDANLNKKVLGFMESQKGATEIILQQV